MCLKLKVTEWTPLTIAAGCLVILVDLAVWSAMLYVVIHFARKLW